MRIIALHPELEDYIVRHQLTRKFAKQKKLFERNPFHPGLETELLEPRYLRLWSFRIDVKYRAIFIFRSSDEVEIIDMNNHYK
jgi:Txe/YoeB family toxin of Txe-Axe toxin-antitoxin module